MILVADLTDEESNSDDDHSVASLGEGKDEETLSAAGNPDVQQLDIEQTGTSSSSVLSYYLTEILACQQFTLSCFSAFKL